MSDTMQEWINTHQKSHRFMENLVTVLNIDGKQQKSYDQ